MFSEELKNATNPSIIKIGTYLQERSLTDPSVAMALKKKNKSLEECYRYILGEAFKGVYKEGSVGAAYVPPEDVYSMAVHYYDEDDIKINPLTGVENTKVVSNHKVADKTETSTETKIHKKAKTKKKKIETVEGQISLFEV